jgi:hypothetical protein
MLRTLDAGTRPATNDGKCIQRHYANAHLDSVNFVLLANTGESENAD